MLNQESTIDAAPTQESYQANCLPLNPKMWCSNHEPKPLASDTSDAADLPPGVDEICASTERLVQSVRENLKYMTGTSNQLEKYKVFINKEATEFGNELNELEIKFSNCKEATDPVAVDEPTVLHSIRGEISELQKKVTRLKLQNPSKFINQPKAYSEYTKSQKSRGSSTTSKQEVMDVKIELFKNKKFEDSPDFKEFKVLYDGLLTKEKICLLSFSIFPENEIISKRFMIYWWIGEGFTRPSTGSEQTAEDSANEVFKQLILKGFIQPVQGKRQVGAKRCKLHPFVRSSLIVLADKAKFLDFDSTGNLTAKFSSLQACLLAGKEVLSPPKIETEHKPKESPGYPNLSKVHMVFNIDTIYLDFDDADQLFPKLKNVNILCLGRWQNSPQHHIEVETTEFFVHLNNMKHLRLLSLQGISRITELPKGCLSKLESLVVLDLRACHNLEVLPAEIGLLKSLTHLDLSECYLLDRVPVELLRLSELQVLKGFVIGISDDEKTCTLLDLVKLGKLRKLSIYTSLKDFPRKQELEDLNRFKSLSKLKITWGGGHSKARSVNTQGELTAANSPGQASRSTRLARRRATLRGEITAQPKLPSKLTKLDLDSFPQSETSTWLVEASKLEGLKKLYLRGGTLCDLGQFDKVEWNVEVLRLKYLNHLDMDWTELQELFPKLVYLEKVKCRRLSLFPCDQFGVWMRKTEKPRSF